MLFHAAAASSAKAFALRRVLVMRRSWQSPAAGALSCGPVAAPDGHRRSAEPPAPHRPAALARRPRRRVYARATPTGRPAGASRTSGARGSTAAQPAQLTQRRRRRERRRAGRPTARRSRSPRSAATTSSRRSTCCAVDGGEARQLTTHASAVSDITWTPDGVVAVFHGARTEDGRREGARAGCETTSTPTTRTTSRRTCGR